jgi:hypothetical protein
MEAQMKNIEVIKHLCEMYSKETLLSAAIIAGSMEVHLATGLPSNPKIAAQIQSRIFKRIEVVLDSHGLALADIHKKA